VSRSGTSARLGLLRRAGARETARTLGSGLVREVIALRGRMDLASYDRLFLAQDAARRRGREPDRRAAVWQVAPRRSDGIPRYRDDGAP
jgi:hypothetical protein